MNFCGALLSCFIILNYNKFYINGKILQQRRAESLILYTWKFIL